MLLQVQNIYNANFDCVANLISLDGELDLDNDEEVTLIEDFLIALYQSKDKNSLTPYFILPEPLMPLAKAQTLIPNRELICVGNVKNNKPLSLINHQDELENLNSDTTTLIIPSPIASQSPEKIIKLSEEKKIILTNVNTENEIAPFIKAPLYFYGNLIEKPQKPKTIQALSVNKSSLLNLVSLLQDSESQIEALSQTVSTCPTLAVKLLQFVNSAGKRGIEKIESIHDAIIRLGHYSLKKLAIILLLSSFEDKPKSLLKLALLRAKICEKIAKLFLYENPDQAYTVGLLSTLDAFIDLPLEEVLSKIALSKTTKLALLNHHGELGQILKIAKDLQHAKLKESDFLYSKIYLNCLLSTDELLAKL